MKKLFTNILFFIVFIFLLEFIAWVALWIRYAPAVINSIKCGDPISDFFELRHYDVRNDDSVYRSPSIKETDKKSILVFGCSVAYGSGLASDNQTFSAKLSELTNRSVYNRAIGGLGPQVMLYNFQTGKVLELTKDVDYVIYVYIYDHIFRNLKFRNFPFLYHYHVRYVFDYDKKLKMQILNPYLAYSGLFKLYEHSMPTLRCVEYTENLFYKVVEESYKKSQEFYPNSKFILLNYSYDSVPKKEQLEKLGISVISLSDLTDINLENVDYWVSEFDHHPNEKAWDLLTPLLMKKTNII